MGSDVGAIGYPAIGTGFMDEWDQPLPYNIGTLVGTNGRIRWRCVSMEINVTIETSALQLSGDIVVAQLNSGLNPVTTSGILPTQQGQLKLVSKWKRYPMSNSQSIRLTMKPTPQDLEYWEVGTANATGSFSRMPGSFIFINAGSADATYSIDVVANWEIAGASLSSITKRHIPSPNEEHTVKMAATAAPSSDESYSDLGGKIYNGIAGVGKYVKTASNVLKQAYNAYHEAQPFGHDWHHEVYLPHVSDGPRLT
jgi:hypothetical protein